MVSFGWKYDFSTETLFAGPPMPSFLFAVRAQAAALAWQCAPRVITRTASREPAPHASDHVPRHVLLSVFLI